MYQYRSVYEYCTLLWCVHIVFCWAEDWSDARPSSCWKQSLKPSMASWLSQKLSHCLAALFFCFFSYSYLKDLASYHDKTEGSVPGGQIALCTRWLYYFNQHQLMIVFNQLLTVEENTNNVCQYETIESVLLWEALPTIDFKDFMMRPVWPVSSSCAYSSYQATAVSSLPSSSFFLSS